MTFTAFYPTLRQGRGVATTITRRWNQTQKTNVRQRLVAENTSKQRSAVQAIPIHRSIEDWDYAVLDLTAAWH